jgi:hypothetical protein
METRTTGRYITGISGLTVRPQTVACPDPSLYSEAHTKAWLNQLPRANVGETAKQVFTRLQDASRVNIPPKVRLGFMAALSDEIERLQENLSRHFQQSTIALSPRQRKVARLAAAIYAEQALAYKQVVDKHLQGLSGAPDKKILVPATTLALYYTSRLIGHYFRLYEEPPGNLWHELHVLFELARANDIDREPVALPKPSIKASSRTLYKANLLIALANPNQLRPGDFWNIQFQHLELARKLRLVPAHLDEAVFVVNLASDAGPFHRAIHPVSGTQRLLGIDTQPLIFYLQTLLSDEHKRRPSTLSANLMRHMIGALGHLSTRAFSRTECSGQVQISFGIGATHAVMQSHMEDSHRSGEDKPEDALSALEGSLRNVEILGEKGAFVPHAQPSVAEQENDAWAKLYTPRKKVDEDPELLRQYHLSQADLRKPMPKSYSLTPAELVNVSPGGYCVSLPSDIPKQTQTDEIIGLLETDSQGQWSWNIGIIRWLKRQGDDLLAGVQLIAPNATPVLISPKSAKATDAVSHRALLLPAMNHIGQPATLVTPAMPYKEGQVIRLDDQHHQREVKLEGLVQHGRGYQRFEFRYLVDPNAENERKKSRHEDDDFGGIWEIL